MCVGNEPKELYSDMAFSSEEEIWKFSMKIAIMSFTSFSFLLILFHFFFPFLLTHTRMLVFQLARRIEQSTERFSFICVVFSLYKNVDDFTRKKMSINSENEIDFSFIKTFTSRNHKSRRPFDCNEWIFFLLENFFYDLKMIEGNFSLRKKIMNVARMQTDKQ